jgi:hypothetical protein
MASKDLQEFYGRVTSDLGVKTVQTLSVLTDAVLDRSGTTPVQKQLLKVLVTEIRAHGSLTENGILRLDNDDQNDLNGDLIRGTAKREELSTLSDTALRAQAKPEGAGVQQKAPASADNAVQGDEKVVTPDDDEQTAEVEAADVALRADLRAELERLDLKQLRERAQAAGVSKDAVEEARDAHDPKAALIELLVARHAGAVEADSAAGSLMLAISAGGEEAADVLALVLEHALELLEALSVLMPRRSRKELRELLERVESVCDSVDVSFCDGVAQCGASELESLASSLACVHGLHVLGAADMDSVVGVSQLLECLARCGSVVLQSLAVLQSDADQSESARVSALEMLRSLSPDRQGRVSSQEAMAAELVVSCLVPDSGAEVGCRLRASGCLALFSLGCRNGVAVCGTMAFLSTGSAMMQSAQESLVKLLSAMGSDNDVLEELATVAASVSLGLALAAEGIFKLPAAVRGPMEKQHMTDLKVWLGLSKLYTEEQICRVLSLVMDHRLFEGVNLAVASGFGPMLTQMCYVHLGLLPKAIEVGVFMAAWDLYGRVCPEPLSAEWWSETCEVVDVSSTCLHPISILLSNVKKLSSTLMDTFVLPSSWWGYLQSRSVW